MKILWMCNIELPCISELLQKKKSNLGGWLDVISKQLVIDGHKLFVIYPHKDERNGKSGNLIYRSFNDRNSIQIMKSVLDDYDPDVIHIWGTEFKYSADFMDIICLQKLEEHTVVSIQGLVHIYAEHYLEGIPMKVIKGSTIRDFVFHSNLIHQQKDFLDRGQSEKRIISKAKHIIGRTSWDRACVDLLNNEYQYHFCNETLRLGFYNKKWDIDNIERYSIFVSQCSYSIKGFHRMISALLLIKQKFPFVHVYTTGKDLINIGIKEKLKLSTYQNYLRTLIIKNDLQNNVTFLGCLDENEMIKRYLNCHVFVSPSNIENSSNSVGEAMLLGVPTVASYVGGTMDLLEHGKDGFLYQSTATYMLAHYIIRIFKDDNLAKQISESAREHAKKTHDIHKNYSDLLQIYGKVK